MFLCRECKDINCCQTDDESTHVFDVSEIPHSCRNNRCVEPIWKRFDTYCEIFGAKYNNARVIFYRITEIMKIYKCKRDEDNDWDGAVIVYAKNESDARRYASKNDNGCYEEDEYIISEIELKEGVIYDDYKR